MWQSIKQRKLRRETQAAGTVPGTRRAEARSETRRPRCVERGQSANSISPLPTTGDQQFYLLSSLFPLKINLYKHSPDGNTLQGK